MKILICLMMLVISGCVSLTSEENYQLTELKQMGITLSDPGEGFEPPASMAAAGFLNILPAMGNVYLGYGDGAEPQLREVALDNTFVFIPLPLISWIPIPIWPVSILWTIPQTMTDANTINQRALAAYYYKSQTGKIILDNWSDPTVSHKPEPKWVSKYKKADRHYKYYVGKADGDNAKQALELARKDAYAMAVKELHGVSVSVRTNEYLTQETDVVRIESTEQSNGNLIGFEEIDSYVISKDGTYYGAVYFRYQVKK